MDIINGYHDITTFLSQQQKLNDDLSALKKASEDWDTSKPVNVGESATLYRFLQFASWKFNLNKTFIKEGSLNERNITSDPKIVTFTLKELLELDNGTTQWASASVIAGNTEIIPNPPLKLQETIEAVSHWNSRRDVGLVWESKRDITLERQAETYMKLHKGHNVSYKPLCSDDYCFARVFEYITKEEGARLWPSLVGHETDRIQEMENAIIEADNYHSVSSKDHRVVQALAMWGAIQHKKLNFKYPNAVNKSWPMFWEFLENTGK